MAGHDYLHSAEVAARPGNTQDWSRESRPRAQLVWQVHTEFDCALSHTEQLPQTLIFMKPTLSSPVAVCGDGSRHEGAVKGAVDEFAAAHGLSVLVTYK